MRSNKKLPKKKSSMLSSLDLLAAFLNFDFDSGELSTIKDSFRASLAFVRFPTRTKCREIQKGLKEDLFPLIAPGRKLAPLDAYKSLYDVVEKINKMQLNLKWAVMPVDYDFGNDVDLELVPIDSTEAKVKMQDYLAPGQEVLQLLNHRWIVSERISLIDAGSLKQYLYWAVIQALENGTISQLTQCKHCNNWFVQEDIRRNFCGRKCKDDFHNRDRIKDGYFSDRRNRHRKKNLMLAERLLADDKLPEQVAKRTGLSVGMLRRSGLLKDY